MWLVTGQLLRWLEYYGVHRDSDADRTQNMGGDGECKAGRPGMGGLEAGAGRLGREDLFSPLAQANTESS